MKSLVDYFSQVQDTHRIAILVITIAIFWHFESILDFRLDYHKWKHALMNSTFVLFDAPVQFVLGMAFNKALHWNDVHHVGIIYHLGIDNPLLMFGVSFILLDFFEYIYHVIMHKFRPLWLFHLVHHSDQNLDVSSTLREHPGETLIRLLFTLLWVFLTGVPFWMLMARQFVQIISNVIAHANVWLPEKVDNLLSYFLVTPNMHQVHHHYKQPFTDSNYGDVLSVWDRLFGTYMKMKPTDIIFGVDSEMAKEHTCKFKNALVLPYHVNKKYKNGEINS